MAKNPETAKAQLMTRIYSQASNDFVLASYKKKDAKEQSNNVIESAIIIAGGANVAFSASNKMQRDTKWAITEVDADQLETLKAHKGLCVALSVGLLLLVKSLPS